MKKSKEQKAMQKSTEKNAGGGITTREYNPTYIRTGINSPIFSPSSNKR